MEREKGKKIMLSNEILASLLVPKDKVSKSPLCSAFKEILTSSDQMSGSTTLQKAPGPGLCERREQLSKAEADRNR